MPDVTPAAVMMSPSSTTRSPSRTSAPKPRRSSIALWWVIAGRPARMPASASSIAPVQTLPIRRPRGVALGERLRDRAAARLG